MLAVDAASPETAGTTRLSQLLSPFNLQLLLMTSSLIVWPSGMKYSAILVKLVSVLIFSPLIPCVIFISFGQKIGQPTLDPDYFRSLGRSLEMASIALVALIDFGLLSCFIVYIRANTRVSNTDAIAPRFLKICYYGTAANVICGGAFTTYLIRFAFMKWNYHSPMYDFLFDAIIHLIFTAVLGTLVGLKVALHSDSESEKLRKKSVYERARFIATGNGVETHPIRGSRMGSKISSPSVVDSRE
ncbi:hypothetical protein HDU77_008170 [Chytriomyces hyalinus]|nr:hypothetical protein HDU77_008170 [Chytriomyces hyalinus]